MRGQTLWQRVWSKVSVPDDVTECWTWTGAKSLKRRGQLRPVIQVGKRKSPIKLVSRLVCEWFNGPPPTPAHEAGHTCPRGENSLCVSPHHLEWMTREENEQYKQWCRSLREVLEESGTERVEVQVHPTSSVTN